MIKWRVYKSFIILRKTITQRLAYNGPKTTASFAPYSIGSIMLYNAIFFLPHYRTFLCVHTLHPSACLCPLTYISSPAFVIFSSLVVKAPWMMSIIPFHIMWRHLSWQSSHCWGIASCLYPNWLSISKELRFMWERTFKIWIISLEYSIISIFRNLRWSWIVLVLLPPYVVTWQLS